MVGVIVALSLLALVVLWLVVVARPQRRDPDRQSASYRDQKTENPDYYPGHLGGVGGGGAGGI